VCCSESSRLALFIHPKRRGDEDDGSASLRLRRGSGIAAAEGQQSILRGLGQPGQEHVGLRCAVTAWVGDPSPVRTAAFRSPGSSGCGRSGCVLLAPGRPGTGCPHMLARCETAARYFYDCPALSKACDLLQRGPSSPEPSASASGGVLAQPWPRDESRQLQGRLCARRFGQPPADERLAVGGKQGENFILARLELHACGCFVCSCVASGCLFIFFKESFFFNFSSLYF